MSFLRWVGLAFVFGGTVALCGFTANLANGQKAPDSRDDALASLLQQRLEAANRETQALEELYRQGRVLIYELLGARQRQAAAGLALARTPDERLKCVRQNLDAAQAHEDIIRGRQQAGLEPLQALYQATALRQSAEIELLKQRAAAGELTAAQLREPVAKLITERHEAAVKETDYLHELHAAGRVPLEQVIDAQQRLARSTEAMYATAAERATHLQGQLKQARAIESLAKAKFDHEIEPRHAYLQARQLRLDLEIEQLRARLAAARLSERDLLNTQMQKLLLERYEAAAAEVSEKQALYRTGRADLYELAAAVRRKVAAGLSRSKSPAEELAHHQAALEAAREFEQIVRAKQEQGVETSQAAHFATGERLTAEIGLVRARLATATPDPK